METLKGREKRHTSEGPQDLGNKMMVSPLGFHFSSYILASMLEKPAIWKYQWAKKPPKDWCV